MWRRIQRLGGLGIYLAGMVAISVGCAAFNDPAMALVRIKAEKDLKCKPDFIEIESEWGGRYQAKGCGRMAEYDSICDGLQCQVTRAGEEAPAWRDRADPGSVNDRTQ